MRVNISIETSTGYTWDQQEFMIDANYKEDQFLKQSVIRLYKNAKGLERKWQSDGEEVTAYLNYELLSEKTVVSNKRLAEMETYFDQVITKELKGE